jgi:hypothetical protein
LEQLVARRNVTPKKCFACVNSQLTTKVTPSKTKPRRLRNNRNGNEVGKSGWPPNRKQYAALGGIRGKPSLDESPPAIP